MPSREKIIPCCAKCGDELHTDENTTLINLGQNHKCEREESNV